MKIFLDFKEINRGSKKVISRERNPSGGNKQNSLLIKISKQIIINWPILDFKQRRSKTKGFGTNESN